MFNVIGFVFNTLRARRIRWAMHVTRKMEKRRACRITDESETKWKM
jgi:hypothetical protein